MISGVSAIVISYLLGSIPSAYIVTRLVSGKDIRKLGGGNVGSLNTYLEVGVLPSLVVITMDIGKGAASVAIAYWLLEASPIFVMLAGLAAVIGHNWMLFLKLSGGKGMGATWGALSVLLPAYGYWQGFLILVAIAIVLLVIMRNVPLALAIVLLFLPLIVWLFSHSALATALAISLGLIIGIKFFPTARATWAKRRNLRSFTSGGDGRPERSNR